VTGFNQTEKLFVLFFYENIKQIDSNYLYYQIVVTCAVTYAENFQGGSKFRHNRLTSQINFRGSMKGSGTCPGKILQNYT